MTVISPGAAAYIGSIIETLAYTPQARERLTVQVPAFWMQQAAQVSALPVIALRTLLDAIALEIGHVDEVVQPTPEGDYHQRMSTRLQALLGLQKQVTARLATLSMTSSAAPGWGLITATVPIPSPPGAPDANCPALRGDPNWPLWAGSRL